MGFKILLTENTSPIGAALFKSLENYSHPVVCAQLSLQDWCSEQRVSTLLDEASPTVVVNPLHLYAEQAVIEEPRSYRILASLCAQRDLTVLHLSSCRVFGDEQQEEVGAVTESHSPEPDSTAGQALRQAELAFAEVRRSIILRPSLLLDSDLGLIHKACKTLCDKDAVTASEQWKMAPVYVEDIVRTVIAMLQQIFCGAENWGAFHLSSSDVCSEAEFIDCIARNLARHKLNLAAITVTAGAEHFFTGNGWLQSNRCTNDFGVQKRSWRKGIKAKVQAWLDKEIEAGRISSAGQGPTPGVDP